MSKLREFTFASCDGKNNIYCRSFLPKQGVRGIVQIAHGIAEHCGRYDELAQHLAEYDFLVVSNDHLGHGRTAAVPEDIGFFSERAGWDKVLEDMRRLKRIVGSEYPDVPYFLFGHSMGSALVRSYMIRSGTGLGGCILSGTCQPPSYALQTASLLLSREQRRAGIRSRNERLMHMALGMRENAVGTAHTVYDFISSDPQEADRYIADPFCGAVPTVGLLSDMIDAMRSNAMPAKLKKMDRRLPVYFMSGARDYIGGCGRGVIRAYRSFLKAGMTDVTLKLYPDGMHELIHEPNREEVFYDVRKWLESKV